MDLVWQTIQQVLSEVFYEYVDYQNRTDVKVDVSSTEHEEFSVQPYLTDLSQYLTKKAPARSSTIPRLFQFTHSAQIDAMNSFLEEQNRYLVKLDPSKTKTSLGTYKQYVCKPHYRNITFIHDVLRRIIEEMDETFPVEPSKRILDR